MKINNIVANIYQVIYFKINFRLQYILYIYYYYCTCNISNLQKLKFIYYYSLIEIYTVNKNKNFLMKSFRYLFNTFKIMWLFLILILILKFLILKYFIIKILIKFVTAVNACYDSLLVYQPFECFFRCTERAWDNTAFYTEYMRLSSLSRTCVHGRAIWLWQNHMLVYSHAYRASRYRKHVF